MRFAVCFDVSLLRQEINDMFENEGSSLSWPPTAKYLNDLNFSLPEKLDEFLTSLLTGKKPQVTTQKLARLVNSIGQDICRAVTHGSWKLPKHILLCMALRHWFRSAEITTLLNRLGHSETSPRFLCRLTALIKLLVALMNYRSSLHFVPVQWFLAELLSLDWNLAKYLVVTTFFRYVWRYWLDFWYESL